MQLRGGQSPLALLKRVERLGWVQVILERLAEMEKLS